MKRIHEAVATGSVLLGLKADSLSTACASMLDFLVEKDQLSQYVRDVVHAVLVERENEAPTAIGNALAVPHAYVEGIPEPMVVFARLARPAQMGAPDGIPTRFVFLLLGPPDRRGDHIDTLAAIARLMSNDAFRYQADLAKSATELDEALTRFERPIEVEPTAVDDGLRYTGKLFGGLMGDVRRRLRGYASDFRDGLHPKSLSATAFLFFACLAPAVTFGGVMADKTGGSIGAVEMLLATAICGIVYSLFAGSPLIILGGTGPLLIITAILYEGCQALGLSFLPVYAWVGLWSALFCVILAITDAGALMRYFTRFTDEVFAALISVIFIVEAVKAILGFFAFEDGESMHDSAFLSLILALGCFYVAVSMFRFRSSRYLAALIREFLADFGPTIALAAMTLIAIYFDEIDLVGLAAPDEFGTTAGREWTIDLFAVPAWVWMGAAVPALLVAILVYLDQNITARVINAPDHKLKRGTSYHLDLAVVGALMALCSLFGLPWLVAATVRSLNHLRALASVEQQTQASGPPRERIIHVRENRITGLTIHVMIGLSLLALPLIKLIPMAVLYGLFLYMGVVSLRGNQFFERLLLWPTDSNLYPSTHYIRKVPLPTIHMFTFVQFISLVVLWIVKVSVVAIIFPVFIALLVPIRFVLGRFIAPEHLEALDSDETPDDEEKGMARG